MKVPQHHRHEDADHQRGRFLTQAAQRARARERDERCCGVELASWSKGCKRTARDLTRAPRTERRSRKPPRNRARFVERCGSDRRLSRGSRRDRSGARLRSNLSSILAGCHSSSAASTTRLVASQYSAAVIRFGDSRHERPLPVDVTPRWTTFALLCPSMPPSTPCSHQILWLPSTGPPYLSVGKPTGPPGPLVLTPRPQCGLLSRHLRPHSGSEG